MHFFLPCGNRMANFVSAICGNDILFIKFWKIYDFPNTQETTSRGARNSKEFLSNFVFRWLLVFASINLLYS